MSRVPLGGLFGLIIGTVVGRCPPPMPGEESEIEIRPIIEAEEFGKEFARGKAK